MIIINGHTGISKKTNSIVVAKKKLWDNIKFLEQFITILSFLP